jgi:predicted  nucleic acid-binding Zn-ribbon protein
MEKNYKSLEE